MRRAVRLVLASALAAAVVPVLAGTASAEVDGSSCMRVDSRYETGQGLNDPDAGFMGGISFYRFDSGQTCIVAEPNASQLDTTRDVGTLTLSYLLDGARVVEQTPFRRARSHTIRTTTPVGSSISDVTMTVSYPHTVVTDEAYTDEVTCLTKDVRLAERQVVRSVPVVETVTRQVTRRPDATTRFAARSALDTANGSARHRLVGAAKRAEARGQDARGAKLRARYARVRAANVADYRAAVAPRAVTVSEPTVVLRDRTITETVQETYDKTGTCTISGVRPTTRTVDSTLSTTPYTPVS